jgi:hypothetical protein
VDEAAQWLAEEAAMVAYAKFADETTAEGPGEAAAAHERIMAAARQGKLVT